MKTYWWLVDEWGCMNLFDSAEAYRYARQHVNGLMECDCSPGDSFKAIDVQDCWKMEDLQKWKDGIMVDGKIWN